jgi:hypothetical protein
VLRELRFAGENLSGSDGDSNRDGRGYEVIARTRLKADDRRRG